MLDFIHLWQWDPPLNLDSKVERCVPALFFMTELTSHSFSVGNLTVLQAGNYFSVHLQTHIVSNMFINL